MNSMLAPDRSNNRTLHELRQPCCSSTSFKGLDAVIPKGETQAKRGTLQIQNEELR